MNSRKDIFLKIIDNRIKISYLFFFVSTTYGFLMRWQKYESIFSYKFNDVMQAHSHTTFLGWGVLSVITLISYVFIDKRDYSKPLFKYSFIIMSLSILGMLISFPLQGYKVFSIVFLSLFLLSSYVFLYALYRNIESKSQAVYFIQSGILYYYLSSMGIWGLSFIAVRLGKGELYHHAISFYTHFLYNGFFVMTLFGLLVYYLEKKLKNINEAHIKYLYRYTNYAVIPSFALSLLWVEMPIYVAVIGFTGAVLQFMGLYFLWNLLKPLLFRTKNNPDAKVSLFLIRFIFLAYVLKLAMQLISSVPAITQTAMQYKTYFVIGYIHLFTLAFMSLLIILLSLCLLRIKVSKIGVYVLTAGIFGSEFLLFLQGSLYLFKQKTISNFDGYMLMVSLWMFLGITLLTVKIVSKSLAVQELN